MRVDDFCSGFEEVYFKTYWGMVLESRNNQSVLEEKKLGREQFGLEIRLQSGQLAGRVWHAYCGTRRARGGARLDTVSCPLPFSVRGTRGSVCVGRRLQHGQTHWEKQVYLWCSGTGGANWAEHGRRVHGVLSSRPVPPLLRRAG